MSKEKGPEIKKSAIKRLEQKTPILDTAGTNLRFRK
jgi:hypothetical protein